MEDLTNNEETADHIKDFHLVLFTKSNVKLMFGNCYLEIKRVIHKKSYSYKSILYYQEDF